MTKYFSRTLSAFAFVCLSLNAFAYSEHIPFALVGQDSEENSDSIESIDELEVIYGRDDRRDLFETKRSYLKLALSTAAMISPDKLKKQDDGSFKIEARTLEGAGVCKEQRFSQQITPARCSGFLVGEDLLVTAGHCVQDIYDCKNYSWVFDFNVSKKGQTAHQVKDSSVYNCVEVIDQALDRSTMSDYALVRLDRKVTGRKPLGFRKTGSLSRFAGLVVIGHPSGLPTKVADKAQVWDNKEKMYFKANLDTFGGNSGSAVFNTSTGLVEGILVRGEQDYANDATRACKVVNLCKRDKCKGESVSRITTIPKLMRRN